MIRTVLPVLRLFTPVLVLLLLSPLTLAAPDPTAQGELPELWSVAAPGPAPWRLHELKSVVLIEDSAGGVTAIDLSHGQPLWTRQMGGELSVSPRENDGTTVLTSGLTCLALDVTTGGVLDRRQLPSPAAAPGVLHSGELYVLTLAGSLHAYEAGAQQRWAYRNVKGLGENLLLVPTLERPLLLLTDGTGRLLALPAQKKLPTSILWEARLGAEPAGRMQLDADGKLHAALRDGQLVSIAADSGRVLWRHTLPGMPAAGAQRAGDTVVAGGGWGVHGRHVDTGQLLWSLDEPALPGASNASSVLLKLNKTSSLWLRARDGKQLEQPPHSPRRLIGDVLLAWDQGRLRAYSAAHPRLERAASASGALN